MDTTARLVSCALACCTACSWIAVKKPPPYPFEQGQRVECTSSKAAPVVDTVLAPTLAASAGLYYAVTSSLGDLFGRHGTASTDAAVIVPTAVLGAGAVAFGFSAWHGYRSTGACNAALACQSGDREACAGLEVTRALARGQEGARSKEPSSSDASANPAPVGR